MWTPPDKLIEFCGSPYARRRGCFGEWPRERIVDYLQHHNEQRTLGVIWKLAEVLAVGTGAQCFMRDFGNPYLPDRADGSCLFLETLIVAEPAAFCGLVSVMLYRWPHWRSLQITGRRNGRIVKYEHRIIEKFLAIGYSHMERGAGIRCENCSPMPITVPV